MSTRLQKLVSLATYGNVTLDGRAKEYDFDTLISHNCYNMEFIEKGEIDIPGSTRVLASNTKKWYTYLLKDGGKRIRLLYSESQKINLDDHISEAFVGGGSDWIVEVQFKEHSHIYSIDETSSRKTQFVKSLHEEGHFNQYPSVVEVRNQMSSVLGELIEFTANEDWTSNWHDIFKGARSKLTANHYDWIRSFIPEGIYSTEASQLLETAFSSWVFGGMGSWNDLAFNGEDQEKYHRLSKELYESISSAVVAVVSSIP